MAAIDHSTQLPPEFVESLSVTAYDTLSKWLRANAPAEVADLFFDFEALSNYTRLVETGAPAKAFFRYGIVEVATTAIQGISLLGGSFKDAYGQEHTAEHYRPKGGRGTKPAAKGTAK